MSPRGAGWWILFSLDKAKLPPPVSSLYATLN